MRHYRTPLSMQQALDILNGLLDPNGGLVQSTMDIERQSFIDYVSNPRSATSKFILRKLDLDDALRLIPVRFGPWDLMTEVGSQHYNLRNTRLQHLIDVIDQNNICHRVEPSSSKSDMEVLRQMRDQPVSFYFRPIKNRIKPSGGFYLYWHRLPLDLSRYGLFTEVPHYLRDLKTQRARDKFRYLLSLVSPFSKAPQLRDTDHYMTVLTTLKLTKEQKKRFRALNEIHSYRVSCLERVLIAWGLPQSKMEVFYSLFGETHLHGMRYIPRTRLQAICDALSINITLKKFTGKTQKVLCKSDPAPDSPVPTYDMGEYDNHYFVLEKTEVSKWSLDNIKTIKHLPNWTQIVSKRTAWKNRKAGYKRQKSRCMTSWQLVKMITDTPCFRTPITGQEPNLRDSVQFNALTRHRIHTSLQYPASSFKMCTPVHAGHPSSKSHKSLYFWFDFESTTEGDHHQCYEVACVDESNDLLYFKGGPEIGGLLLEAITIKIKDEQRRHNTSRVRAVMIAHYLTYDFQFMVKFLHLRADNLMSRSNIKMVKGHYNYSTNQSFQVWLKDSACLIPMALSKFGKCFNLTNPDGTPLHKDVMPYGAMTQETLKKPSIPLSLARKHMDPKDYDQFIKNLESLGLRIPRDDRATKSLPKGQGDHFDHHAYSKHYCIRDVRVLKQGYLKWRQMMLEVTNLDIHRKVTLPSIAHNHARNQGVYAGVTELSGIPREFIQRSVEGGRTMTRDNKMWHCVKRNQDLDGISLYPSAMFMMPGVLKGTPKELTALQIRQINHDKGLLRQFDGYFLRIHVTRVGRHFAFPLLSKMDHKGVRQYRNEPGFYYVDRFKLEDLIEFHLISFTVLQGYYFNEGRNTKIKSFMDSLFQERLKQKALKNPIQKVFKELMNSTYGRTIMKPIEKDLHFVYGKKALHKKLDWFHFCHNGYDIVDAQKEIYVVEMERSRGLHYAMPQVGSEILSYSKRIMNQVLCLAEDIGATVYYQDTDSMHIHEEDIEMLATAFRAKYRRDLVGKQMGQFHCDFDAPGKDPVSIESFFLGKKAYIDLLEYKEKDGSLGNTHHIRLKGVPTPCIKKHCELSSLSLMQLYNDLFNHKIHAFDLLNRKEIKPYFDRGRTFQHRNRSQFVRRLQFKLPHGTMRTQ